MKGISTFLMAAGTILPRICAVRIGRHLQRKFRIKKKQRDKRWSRRQVYFLIRN